MAALPNHCPICAGSTEEERSLFDDRYGYPGRYSLQRCVSCGHCSLRAAMSPAEIARLYTEYYPRSSFDVEHWTPPGEASRLKAWWRGLRASAFRWVPPNVRVLDIGCGFGESLGYHRARGCDAHGVEADRNILRVADRHGLNVEVGLFDPANYEPGSFDVVTLDQVIEHVSNPKEVLSGVHQVLKPGGLLVLSTPNASGWGARLFGQRWIHWHAPYHLQFFNRASIERGASQAGFTLDRSVTVTSSAWLDFQWGHLACFPREGQPSTYWNATQARSIGLRIALRFFLIVDRLGLNALATRTMDFLGRGDNVVYLLRKQAR